MTSEINPIRYFIVRLAVDTTFAKILSEVILNRNYRRRVKSITLSYSWIDLLRTVFCDFTFWWQCLINRSATTRDSRTEFRTKIAELNLTLCQFVRWIVWYPRTATILRKLFILPALSQKSLNGHKFSHWKCDKII